MTSQFQKRRSLILTLVVACFVLLPSANAQSEAQRIAEQVRHELAMMPYISVFDYLTASIQSTNQGTTVILKGYTIRPTNKSNFENRVKQIEGVTNIVNEIEVLPVSGFDDRIRAQARAVLQRWLPRYFSGVHADIRIIVKNSDIYLYGAVDRKMDYDIATVQLNSIPGVFAVHNNLRILNPEPEKKKKKKKK
jgi:osmotically-inducible protein OsmY